MLMRRWIFVLVGLLATVSLMACGGAQSRFDTHMKRGQAYFAAGDYTKASIEYRNALQIEPKSVQARLAAGRAAEKMQRPRDAFGFYQSVVDSTPDNSEAREDLARLLIYSKSPDLAMKILEPALAKHPDDAELLTLRAATRTELKETSGALADADRALQLAPDNEEAIQVRAGLYKQAGDVAGARALVEGAAKKLPASRSLREMLVDLELAGQEPDLAEQSLSELISLAPQEVRYRYQLAILYSRTHKLDEAQKVLEGAVTAVPKSNEAKLALVDFLSSQRTHAQAEQILRTYIDRDPDNFDLRLGLGALQQRAGEAKGATATYNEIVRRDGTQAKGLTARDRLADIAAAEGRDDDARKLIEEVLQKNPRDDDALSRRAAIELAHADPAAAITDLRGVLRDHPQSVGVQRMLAHAYLANGQPALAEQSLKAAMDVAPTDPGLRIEFAQLLLQTARTDQAVETLEEVVRRNPADVAGRTELIRAYLAKQDFNDARKSAEDLKTLRPDSGEGAYYAGMAAVGQNKPDEARREFEQSLSLQPRAFGPLTALARLDVATGKTPQAVSLIKDAAATDPQNAQILNFLGELYLGQLDIPQATDTFNRVIKLVPKWWVPWRNLAVARLEAKDSKGAVAAYEGGIKVAPDQLQLVNQLALLYEADRRVDDAAALFNAAYQRNPHADLIANNLAMLLVTYKTDRQSLDRARDLTSGFASSTDGKLLDTYGWVHFKRGEYSDALAVLGRAAARAPDSKEIRYHLGMAELHLGQIDRARQDLETAVSGSGKFFGSEEARMTLTSLKQNSG